MIPPVFSDGQFLPQIFIKKSCSKANQNDDKYDYILLDPYTRTMLKERRSLLLINEKTWCNTKCMLNHIIPFILIKKTKYLYFRSQKDFPIAICLLIKSRKLIYEFLSNKYSNSFNSLTKIRIRFTRF